MALIQSFKRDEKYLRSILNHYNALCEIGKGSVGLDHFKHPQQRESCNLPHPFSGSKSAEPNRCFTFGSITSHRLNFTFTSSIAESQLTSCCERSQCPLFRVILPVQLLNLYLHNPSVQKVDLFNCFSVVFCHLLV